MYILLLSAITMYFACATNCEYPQSALDADHRLEPALRTCCAAAREISDRELSEYRARRPLNGDDHHEGDIVLALDSGNLVCS